MKKRQSQHRKKYSIIPYIRKWRIIGWLIKMNTTTCNCTLSSINIITESNKLIVIKELTTGWLLIVN